MVVTNYRSWSKDTFVGSLGSMPRELVKWAASDKLFIPGREARERRSREQSSCSTAFEGLPWGRLRAGVLLLRRWSSGTRGDRPFFHEFGLAPFR